jgi:4-hydroxybenzoyl-CoA thioesterase/acyl-CoA thioester hydrolase
MATNFQSTKRVEFHHTDAGGIMHFSAFFTFMEEVEHELLRHFGLSVMMHDQEGTIGWPRVSAQCDFKVAVRFEDVLEIKASIERVGEKSVTYAFEFEHEGRSVAKGMLTSVCCRLRPGARPQSIPIPQPFLESLATMSPK